MPHIPEIQEPRMFDGEIAATAGITVWLKALEEHEPDKRHGELIVKNLLEDQNVSEERAKEFERLLIAEIANGASSWPMKTLKGIAQQNTLLFDSPFNALNHIAPPPFSMSARVVSLVDFIYFNALNGELLTRKPEKEDQLCDILAAELQSPDFDKTSLRKNIGRDCVFATDSASLFTDHGELKPADEIRDCLGLDYMVFDAGHRLVCFFYDAKTTPDAPIYKPTVLEAPTHHPFMPSLKTDVTGFTQRLDTGESGAPEVIHRTFPAARTRKVFATDKLEEPRPQGYITKRLGPRPI